MNRWFVLRKLQRLAALGQQRAFELIQKMPA